MYLIKNTQSKTTVEERIPSLSLVAAKLKEIKPRCFVGYHPFAVGTDHGGGFQQLSIEDEEQLADLAGLRVTATGQKSSRSEGE